MHLKPIGTWWLSLVQHWWLVVEPG